MSVKRFFETLHPEHYDLFIDVNREKKLISGSSTITAEAQEPTVLVHQKFMQIKQVKADGQAVPFTFDDKNEEIKIELGRTGKVKLVIDYTAPLTDTMMGIYPSYYTLDGEKKQIIGTQFETTFARQAFPCVDEPEAKATFNLALKFDEQPGEIALANMPEVKVEDGVHYFDETVRMSTYLVAFAFGDLQAKYTETKSGVKVGVFATKAHQAKELDFALDIAKRGIEFYEDFYQTPYPLPHSWQLALPDFSAGAMENWGLITYREAYLLLDPDNTSLPRKKLVATVITHELAHQWFGDLVTMKWWDNLWLNESFANMMEYLSIDHMEPNWKIWEMFQTSEAPAALTRDATDGVQSVYVKVNDPAEIDTLFDGAIVYAKGSRLLVMVRALLGDEALQKGLKYYFDHHKYSNTIGDDLWEALSTATDLNITEIMHSWLNQPGYPVINAYVEDGHLKLSQKQFFIGEGEDKGRTWQIPLNANFDAPKIMAEKVLDLGDYQALREKAGHALRINVGNTTHAVVKYDETLMADILKDITDLDAISKMQILQDLRLLAEGKQVSYASVVPVLLKLKDDQSSVVNDAIYTTAAKLRQFVANGSEAEKQLKQFYNLLSKDQVARLGWQAKDGESSDDTEVRPYVLQASLYGENADAIKAAHEIFRAERDHLEGIEAAVRPMVLRNEVKNFGTDELIDELIKLYQTTSDASFKSDLCAAIIATKDPKEIEKLIGNLENADIVKPQDLRAWFAGLLNNEAGEQAAWDWIRDEWAWLDKTVGGDMEFTTFITVIARIFKNAKRLQEFKDFFLPKLDQPMLTREIKMDVKVIETRVNLVEAEGAAVKQAVAAAL
ncbi:M1 family metallopeptidase [Lactobacillus corticis]|uniref:Aminopeptidase n=1 Tax=Lactobacillus corticis TaxID=2201249 RepID=A0A916QFN8_9LACO|nr:M1 family metallopeptidase [Lactobacillus corticis]GFZ26426.1 aminopeptidase N [Lactobacillus corticis]